MKAKYRVTLTEHERNWGPGHVCDRDFNSYEAALKYSDEENAKNTAPTAPDYYISASEPYLVDLDKEKEL